MRTFFVAFLLTSGLALAQQSVTLQPLTAKGRVSWAAYGTLGLPNLSGGLISSGWGTLFNKPPEYGPHWAGFGKRYGMRLTGSATSNTMEVSLGALWGEDPRYYRLGAGESPGSRVKNALKQAFLAHDRNGKVMPAYARYAAIPGANFLSNTWRADSEAEVSHALVRTGLGFLARITSNAFAEFWPDIKGATRRKK